MNGFVQNRAVRETLQQLSYLFLQPEELIIGNGSQIGSGGYGEVLLAKLRRGDEAELDVAVKCVWAVGTRGDRERFAMVSSALPPFSTYYSRHAPHFQRFARELKVWATVKHLNVLPLLGFYLSDSCEIAQLVSPFKAHGNVVEYIKRTGAGLDKRLKFVQDITAGLGFLHNHNPPVCHGDLKPTNVLVTDGFDAVLCDFGLASFANDASAVPSGLTTSRSIKGSTRYMGPELLLENETKHTLRSDVWAWACTTFEVGSSSNVVSAQLLIL
ncbi:hypothetical protein M407DRAFT_219210 [Tulasnella calospora MUT 4182]|uniref:Protein kinase domain-containing protein n=1 Tax=Tulasnella calospora MUT 4182 TaxID=1051891 RepID=A0A0C3Q968_9AGAM|nr:hypothetical protein M407DRAFT_219210 [Tulasnella calospora MUT 4182]